MNNPKKTTISYVKSNCSRYWLYAAVSCKCLLVTNDEMRDHLFQLLGNSFFPRWKEKHQVTYNIRVYVMYIHKLLIDIGFNVAGSDLCH